MAAAGRARAQAWCLLLLLALVIALARTGAPGLLAQPAPHSHQLHGRSGGAGGSSCGKGPPLRQQRVPRACQLYRRACLDQGVLVLHDGSLTPEQPEAWGWGQSNATVGRLFTFPWPDLGPGLKPDAVRPCADQLARAGVAAGSFPQLLVRPPSSLEPTEDLQAPRFDSCVVPLVLYAHWFTNWAHVFCQAAGWLYTVLRRQQPALGGKVQLVVVTPAGLGLPPSIRAVLQPLSGHPVVTLAELSNRPPAEGGAQHSRCFQSLLVCGGPANPMHLYETGQFYVRHFLNGQQQQQERQQQQRGPGLPPQLRFRTVPAAQPRSPPAARKQLRVVFHARSGGVRQILNQQELLERCARWTYVQPGTSILFTAACAAWEFTDIASSVQVAQQADVFVAMHGANVANAWFMRPGSSMVEVHSPGYPWSDLYFNFNRGDPKSGIFWWNLRITNTSALTPGEAERRGLGCPDLYLRDKNAVVRWEALEGAFRRIANVDGSPARYAAFRSRGQHEFHA